ncbi:MAG: hypothetical protein IPP18_16810 [Rhodocyclaceae bacterium]|nr:hypothetical protein [Rhodocyclaceae bacterium]
MPYYLYRVTQAGPVKQLEKITEFGFFKHASAEAKRLRQASDLPAGTLVKVIFAENELQAEDLLNQVREGEPLTGDDW